MEGTTPTDRIVEMQKNGVDVGQIFEPRVNITFTMAATKARDIGVVVETKGEITEEQGRAALLAAAKIFGAAHLIAVAFHTALSDQAEIAPEHRTPLDIAKYL